MSDRVTAAEAAALLREIVEGARRLRLHDPRRPWVQIAVGECTVAAGDAQLVFYADSATLDHLVRVRLADGRGASFTDWMREGEENPLALLDEGERFELEQRLHQAQ